MSALYPLLLVPEFQERVWGARDLSPIYAQKPEKAPIGEVWLTGDENRVANGPLRGRSLADLAGEYGRELVGETALRPERFPLLTKFLFPKDKLSVQVHPDDETARRAGLPCGKTECWYVVAAERGAKVALGLKPGTTKAELEHAIHGTRAEELLNWVEVNAGEMIYVAAGTVHTIGPGMILLETQQNSDTTYRLYDYGRPRQLHVREALEATKLETAAGKVRRNGSGDAAVLVDSPCFVVKSFRYHRELWHSGEERGNSVEILVATGGCGVVEAAGAEPVTMSRGDAVVIPASVREFFVRPQWEVEFLTMAVPPAGTNSSPDTYLETVQAVSKP